MNKNRNILYICLLCIFVMASCSTSDLDPSLEQQKESDNAIETAADLEGILKGAYNRMTSSSYYGRDYIVTNEVRTPNTWSNGNSGRFTTEGAYAYNNNTTYIWNQAYSVIASANIVIGANLEELSDYSSNQEFAENLQGQAYVIRALAHFDLLKVYGQEHVEGDLGIPYMLEFGGENEFPSRNTIAEVRGYIYEDLQTGFDLMSDDFFDSSKEFMSKYTAKAVESRVGVWFEDWQIAADAADEVINSGDYSILDADSFVSTWANTGGGAANSIFELSFSTTDNQGINGLSYIYRGTSYGDISVTPNAFNDLYSDGDVREGILGTEEVGSVTRLRNLGKYTAYASNIPVIRYEEVILNYAEALFELGETANALSYLNMIPENRNADSYASVSIDNILEERRKEFLFEGLYYWDLQRLNLDIEVIDDEQNIDEAIPYGDFRRVHPIPISEIDANSNVVQNPGY